MLQKFKIEDEQGDLEDIALKLIEAHKTYAPVDVLVRLKHLLDDIDNGSKLRKFLSEQLDPDIFRLLALFFEDTRLTMDRVKYDPVLPRAAKDRIVGFGDGFGERALDELLLSKFGILPDKIYLFQYLCTSDNEQFERSAEYILGLSYIADQKFYEHLERIILQSDNTYSFPGEYSFNPFYGHYDKFRLACSNLFLIATEQAIKYDANIDQVRHLISRYYPVFKYEEEHDLIHPIFKLLDERQWQSVIQWLDATPALLLLKRNRTSLITEIITTSHDPLKGKEHDKLFALQKAAIKHYVANDFDKKHEGIAPQIALFIGYTESTSKKDSVYYAECLTAFIELDHQLDKNRFLHAKCNLDDVKTSLYSLMLNLGYKILLDEKPSVSLKTIVLHQEQKDSLKREEVIPELYGCLKSRRRINDKVIHILSEIQENLVYCQTSLNRIEVMRETKKMNILSALFLDYLDLKYSTAEIQHDNFSRDIITEKFHEVILTLIKQDTFNFKEFCLKEGSTFDLMCKMGELDFLNVFRSRVHNDSYKHVLFSTEVNQTSLAFIKSIAKNAIRSFWYSHSGKSDAATAEKFIDLTYALNNILRTISGSNIVDLTIKQDKIGQNIYRYLATSELQVPYVQGLRVDFENGDFLFNGISPDAKDYIDLYNIVIVSIAKQFLWIESEEKQSIEENKDGSLLRRTLKSIFNVTGKKPNKNVLQELHIQLLHLSHPLEDSNQRDVFQINLHNNIDLLVSTEPSYLKEIQDPTSQLWQKMKLLGTGRALTLLDHFIEKGYLAGRTYDLHCIVVRCIQKAILSDDLDGMMRFLEWGLKRFSTNLTLLAFASVDNIADGDQEALLLVHNTLLAAVIATKSEAVSMILDALPKFLLLYRDKEICRGWIHLFAIISEQVQSKLLEIPACKSEITKIVVCLLEHGYPIEIIEKSNSDNYREFFTSLLKEQASLALKSLAIDWVTNAPKAIPFVDQISVVFDPAKDLMKHAVAVSHYARVYQKSFEFIHKKLSEEKIDLSSCCHLFAAITQPDGFVKRLEKISFFKGIRQNFYKDEDQQILERSARIFAKIADGTTQWSMFTARYKQHVHDSGISDLKSSITSLYKEEIKEKKLKKPRATEIQNEKFSFLLYQYKNSLDEETVVYNPTLSENAINMVANIGAGVISGTFVYINDPLYRNFITALVSITPTLCNVVSTVVNKNAIFSMVEIIPQTALVTFAGLALFNTYDKCVQGLTNTKKPLKFEINSIEKALDEIQKKDGIAQSNHTSEEIYEFIKYTYTSVISPEFIPIENFLYIMDRFGLTNGELSCAIQALEDENDVNDLVTIAYALSIVAMYINTKKVISIMDKIGLSQENRIKAKDILHAVLQGDVSNLTKVSQELNIDPFFNLEALRGKGIPVLMDHYDPNQHDLYLFTMKNIVQAQNNPKMAEKLESDLFYRFIRIVSNQLFKEFEAKIALGI